MNERVLLPESLLARISAPVQFVWGAEDPNGGQEIARQFVGLLPNAELDPPVEGAGHFLQEDRGEIVGARIAEWLSSR